MLGAGLWAAEQDSGPALRSEAATSLREQTACREGAKVTGVEAQMGGSPGICPHAER